MDFNGLYWFVKVVELGSMSKAARNDHCAVSTVSARISQLEKQLGVRLMERTTRKIRLTDAGEAFYERAKLSVQSAEAAQWAVEELSGSPSGLLTATVTPEIMTPKVYQQLQAILATYPDLKLRLMLSSERKDMLAENVDVAIRTGQLNDSQMVARKLTDLTLRAVATAEFLESQPVINHPADLENIPCIPLIDESGKAHPWTFFRDNKEVQIMPSGDIEVNNMRAGMALAKQHQGVALTSHWGQSDQDRDLVTLLPDWVAPSVPVWAVFPSKAHLPPKTRVFIDFMLDVFDVDPAK